MNIAAGTRLGRYEIRSKLGEGGMGEVYLTQDTKLDRKVALKILPAELAANQDRMRRFVQEAKAAAALNHPNIATIHEIGESDGVNYIAMEFIDGTTLREKIHQEQTDLRKLLRFLQHVAEGLVKAHAAGIVHRDLKSDNVMITRDGHAKILDFGLAKLIEQPPISGGDSSEVATAVMPQHSTPGAVMGTVGYMSPEQAQGKTKEIDQRSDIFSFGCILFEAVTGKKPFEGDSIVKSLHMVIYEPAPSLTEFNPSAPTELQRIVRRCLAKDPDERYQSIKEVAIELKQLRRELEGAGLDTTVPPPSRSGAPLCASHSSSLDSALSHSSVPSPSLQTRASSAEYVVSGIRQHKLATVLVVFALIAGAIAFGLYLHARNSEVAIESIAVLPFENKSGNADSEYLSDGLAESLIYRLSQLPNLKVSPTSSVVRYKGKETDVQKIGSELGVNAIMSGRMVQRGDNLTISVELVDARTNKLIWGEQYERKLSDLLTTQREIAAAIAQKLQLKLAGNDAKGITKRYTNNNEAYQLYLKGRFYFARRTKDNMFKSIELFKQAVSLDPNFALAYVGIAESYSTIPSYPYASPAECVPQAKAAVARALEIDPELPEAHTVAAMIAATHDWDYPQAEREFKRSLELDPNLAITHYRYGWTYLSPLGRHDEAIAEMKRAMELEPLSIMQGANFAAVLMYAGRFDEAIGQARKTYELDPSHIGAQNWLCHTLNAKGLYADAISVGEKAEAAQPTTVNSFNACLGLAYRRSGQQERSRALLAKIKEAEKTRYVMSYWSAIHFADLGEKEAAWAELEKGYRNRDWFMQRLKTDPFIEPLRSDPRYKEMLKRLNLPD
ncbi:MAG: protein kinase domain-containing protein [Acidobacteriota bacterium]